MNSKKNGTFCPSINQTIPTSTHFHPIRQMNTNIQYIPITKTTHNHNNTILPIITQTYQIIPKTNNNAPIQNYNFHPNQKISHKLNTINWLNKYEQTRTNYMIDVQNQLNIIDNDYNRLKPFDFYQFEKILKQIKQFKTTKDFEDYRKNILNCVKYGSCEPIKLTKNHFGDFKIIDGKVRLLAHKLLGIEPIFEII